MTKKGVAEWVSIILCLLPSPFVIMFLLIVAGEIREAWHITNFLAVTLCAIVGLIALLFTSWVLGKLVYFIIKKNNSRYSTYTVLYRSYRKFRYNCTVTAYSFPSGS